MASKLYGSSSSVGHSYNFKVSNKRHNHFPGLPGNNRLISAPFSFIRKRGYKLLFVVMLVALFISIVPALLGCRFEAIRSGSMSPGLDTGSLAVTVPVNPYAIDIGDVIAYELPSNPDTVIVHRVAGISNDGPLGFRTKGDANASLDASLLPADAVLGRVKFQFPLIGYFVGFIQSPAGFVTLLVIPGAIVLYLELSKLWALLGLKGMAGQRLRNTMPSLSRRKTPSVYNRLTTYKIKTM